MNQLFLNAIALVIFLMTSSILLGPLVNLPFVWPASFTVGLLGLASLDTLGFQSQGTTLFLDWIAQNSPRYQQRILHHEAGHFLVAHLLGLPVKGYTLSAWEAWRQGHRGQGGVRVDAPDFENCAWMLQNLDRYCAVWMAGSVAESLVYNSIEGGRDDRQKLREIVTQLNFNVTFKERQAERQARQLLQNNWKTYEALVAAMAKRASVADCSQLIDDHQLQDHTCL
jgi:hypothetical protein